jgi:hypothetical protein
MVDGVMAGLSAFSGLIGMARGLKDINDGVVRNEAIFELTSKLLDAQQEYAALLARVGELEKKLTSFENWEREKERYELKEHGFGKVLAYALKEGVDPPEHPHSVCPDCYQQGKRAILQTVSRFPGRNEILLCQACGWEAYTTGHWSPDHAKANHRRPR